MALGNRNSNGSLISLKPVFKEDGEYVTPYFRVRRKVDGNWVDDENGVSSVFGDLTNINIEEKDYQGKKYKEVSLFLRDNQENESYVVNLRFTVPSRSLFNAMASLEDPRNLSLSLYKDKKKGFGRYGLWQNDELVKWKYDIEELPEAKEVEIDGGTMRVYGEVNKFLENELVELNERVKEFYKSNPSGGSSSVQTKETVPSDDTDDDNIPF